MSLTVTILILMSIQFMTAMVMDVVMSNAPALALTYNIAEASTPLLNIGFLLSGILGPIFGFMADKKSIKYVLVLGTFLFTLGCFLTAYTNSVAAYIVTRGLIGVGYNIFFGLVAAYLAKLVNQRQLTKLSGYTKLAFAGGVFTAPVLGNYLISMGGFKLFYLWVTGISLLLALLLVKIPEAKGDLAQSLTLSDFKALLKEPYVIILMATNIFLSYPANVVFYYLSIYLSSIGFDHATIAIVYSLLGVASFLSGLIMIFLGKYFNLRQFVKLGTIGLIIALAPMITLWPLLLVPFGFVFGISIDLVYGAFFPMTARLELNRSASLITLASLSASISSVLATLLNPFLYERIGFGGLLALSLFASAIAYLGITSIYRLKPEQL